MHEVHAITKGRCVKGLATVARTPSCVSQNPQTRRWAIRSSSRVSPMVDVGSVREDSGGIQDVRGTRGGVDDVECADDGSRTSHWVHKSMKAPRCKGVWGTGHVCHVSVTRVLALGIVPSISCVFVGVCVRVHESDVVFETTNIIMHYAHRPMGPYPPHCTHGARERPRHPLPGTRVHSRTP